MKKIISIVLTYIMLISCFWIPAFAQAEDFSYKILIINSKPGDVYFDTNPPSFYLDVENRASNVYDFDAEYKITDEYGDVLWQGNDELSIEAKTKKLIKINVPKSGYGLYKLIVSVNGILSEKEFSIAAANSEIWDFMSVQMHKGKTNEIDTPESAEATSYLTQNSGMRWVRNELIWKYVEKQEGVYTFDEWIEDNINTLVQNGNQVLLMLNIVNPLYDADATITEPQMPIDETGREKYKAFCEEVARHYAGRVEHFQIGNEPNRPSGSGWEQDETQSKGVEYGLLLKAAYEGIKAGNPNAKVICAPPTSPQIETVGSKKFIEDLFTVDNITSYMDAFAVHPYNHSSGYADEVNTTFLEMMNYVRTVLENAGVADMPIWISEYGMTTYTDDGQRKYTDRQQAADLVRVITSAASIDNVEKFSIYNLRTKAIKYDRSSNFGITGYNYEGKPAFLAVSNLNNKLNKAEFVETNAVANYNSWLSPYYTYYRFKKGTEDVFVIWEGASKTANLNVSQGENNETTVSKTYNAITISVQKGYDVEITDMYGNLIDSQNVALSDEPVFVRCRPKTSVIRENERVQVIGHSDAIGKYVTMYGVRRGEFINEVVAIDQTKIESDGNYVLEATIPAEAYYLYVVLGDSKTNYGIVPDYDIDMTEGKDGEISVTITDNNESGRKLMLFGAVYEEDRLKYVDMKETSWQGNTATLKMQKEAGMKLMLFGENQEPVAKSLSVE